MVGSTPLYPLEHALTLSEVELIRWLAFGTRCAAEASLSTGGEVARAVTFR
jgi:hypothetical protein